MFIVILAVLLILNVGLIPEAHATAATAPASGPGSVTGGLVSPPMLNPPETDARSRQFQSSVIVSSLKLLLQHLVLT